jgi:hypothetical protein
MAMTPNVVRSVLELHSQDIARALDKNSDDILATSVFHIRDYELARLLQMVYNKAINHMLDGIDNDLGRSQYD